MKAMRSAAVPTMRAMVTSRHSQARSGERVAGIVGACGGINAGTLEVESPRKGGDTSVHPPRDSKPVFWQRAVRGAKLFDRAAYPTRHRPGSRTSLNKQVVHELEQRFVGQGKVHLSTAQRGVGLGRGSLVAAHSSRRGA